MAKGKGKGAQFEREVSRRLSLWLTCGERDDLFWRSAMSGGRATVQFKKGITNRAQAGDLCAIDSAGEALLQHVVVECKFHADLVIVNSFLGDGHLRRLWDKHVDEAKRTDREPFMVAKENRTPALLITTPKAVRLLGITDAPPITLDWLRPSLARAAVFEFDKIVPREKEWEDAAVADD
jgi:hypothetical protein